jgi:hypothetical protein
VVQNLEMARKLYTAAAGHGMKEAADRLRVVGPPAVQQVQQQTQPNTPVAQQQQVPPGTATAQPQQGTQAGYAPTPAVSP